MKKYKKFYLTNDELIERIKNIFKNYGSITLTEYDKNHIKYKVPSSNTIRQRFGSMKKFKEITRIEFKKREAWNKGKENPYKGKKYKKNNIIRKTKGYTLTDIYGKERAKQILLNMGKGKTFEERYGEEKSNEIKKKLSISMKKHKYKGLTFKNKFGEKKAKEISKKISKKLKGKNKEKNRGTYESKFGIEKAKKIKEKMSNNMKGKNIGTYEEKFGKEKALKLKKELSKKRKGKVKWKKEDLIQKIQKIFKENGHLSKTELENNKKELNFCTLDVIRKQFGSTDKFAEYAGVEFKIPFPQGRIGNNEEFILEHIKKQENIKLIHQYYVAGKFTDAYDPINNVVYEVDESFHKYQRIQDIIRENQIKEKLKCEFIRINEQEFLNNLKNKVLGDF